MSPPPLANATLPGWPHFDADQIDAVRGVLDSGRVNYWTGEHGRLFEREYADHVGVGHGIALANGSVALELALYALGIGPGDEVIVTPRTFIASASSIVIRGATPVFADVDPISSARRAKCSRRSRHPRRISSRRASRWRACCSCRTRRKRRSVS